MTDNLALGRPVLGTPASVDQTTAERAVDGSRGNLINGFKSQCYSSQSATDPWWSVDLGSAKVIRSFVITSREDVFGIYSTNYLWGVELIKVCMFVCSPV